MGWLDQRAKKEALTLRQIKPLMNADLKRSGLTPQDAKKLGFTTLTAAKAKALGFKPYAGYLIPYHTTYGDEFPHCVRIRYLEDVKRKGKLLRYEQTQNTMPMPYFPKGYVNWTDIIKNVHTKITLTEGEKKAAKASKEGIPTIALGGVWSFQSAKRNIGFLPDLKKIAWHGRDVELCFDNDVSYKDDVIQALMTLAQKLTKLGARVYLKHLPLTPEKIAIDDYLVEHGAEAYRQLPREEFDGSQTLWQLQERYAFIQSANLIYDTKLATPGSFLTSAFKLNTATAPYNYEEGKKTVKAIDVWLAWKQRRTYTRLTYEPGEPALTGIEDTEHAGKAFNLWRGFATDPAKGNVSPFIDLFDYVFSEATPEFKEWALQWIAYPIQNPGTKLFSALVVIGGQGTGKTFLGNLIGKVYGTNFVTIGEDQLHSQFNAWLTNKQFVLAEEVTGKHGTTRDIERLKFLITSKVIRLNEKYAPSVDFPGVANFYFTSNRPDAIYLEYNDRRYAVNETPKEGRARSFYERIDAWQKKEDNIKALHYYLLNEVDTASFNPNEAAPMSVAKSEMMRAGSNPVETWLSYAVENPDAHLVVGGTPKTLDLFTEEDLVGMMPDDVLNYHERYPRTIRHALNARTDITKRAQIEVADTFTGNTIKRTLYALKNADKWKRRKPRQWSQHWLKHYKVRPKKHRSESAQVVTFPKQGGADDG